MEPERVDRDSTGQPSVAEEPRKSSLKPRLYQLDGFRFLVAFWLVFAHNYDSSSPQDGLYERFCLRRYVAVQFFLVLSGFVSQYAYGTRDFSSPETIRKFYVGRYGAIYACFFVTQLLSVVVRCLTGQYSASFTVKGSVLSLFLLQAWIPKFAYFGNSPAWTLSTLAAHWLAYPVYQRYFKGWSDRTLFMLLVIVPVVAWAPALLCLSAGDWTISAQTWYILYTQPILRFPDFFYGSILAEIFLRGYRPKVLGPVSELALPAVLCLVLGLPFIGRDSVIDTLMIEGLMHIFGLLILGSSCDVECTLFSRFMAWKPCRDLGDFAFQVYLWRWPIFMSIKWWDQGFLTPGWNALRWPLFFPAMLLLYIVSYVWYRFVDNPLRLYLQEATKPSQSELSTDLIEHETQPNSGVVV